MLAAGDPDMVWYDEDSKNLYIKDERGEYIEVTLRPKEYGIWELLSRHNDEAVSREQMCEEVWGGRYVTDFTINQTINQLRKKIGIDGKKVIITVPRKGYAINSSCIALAKHDAEDVHPQVKNTVPPKSPQQHSYDSTIIQQSEKGILSAVDASVDGRNSTPSEKRCQSGRFTSWIGKWFSRR